MNDSRIFFGSFKILDDSSFNKKLSYWSNNWKQSNWKRFIRKHKKYWTLQASEMLLIREIRKFCFLLLISAQRSQNLINRIWLRIFFFRNVFLWRFLFSLKRWESWGRSIENLSIPEKILYWVLQVNLSYHFQFPFEFRIDGYVL